MTDTINPQKIYAIFGKYGPHTNMRKFSLEPFVGACEYVLSSTPESRDKAIDELVKHDQEIGLYDAPDCDAGKDCPKQWGEPFYGSKEIDNYVDANVFDMWYSRGEWKAIGSCFGASTLLIYRLPANHHFYKTALFKNAQKPDANHPCRGGE